MNGKIRPGQLMVLLILAAAPALLQGQGTVPGLLLGSALPALLLPLLLYLPSRTPSLPTAIRNVFGTVLSLFFLWEAVCSGVELGRFAAATEQEPFTSPVLAAVLLLTAAWGAAQGPESLARSAGLWLVMGLVLLFPVWGVTVPAVSLNHLRTHWADSTGTMLRDGLMLFTGFGGELILLWLLAGHAPALHPRHGLLFPVGVLVLGLPCIALAAGMLGSWASVRPEPFYTALLSLRPDAAFRPDSFYTVVRIAAHYSRAALFLTGFYILLRALSRHRLRRFCAFAGTAAAILCSALLTRHPDTVVTLTRLCQGPALAVGVGLPLLTGRRRAL
jgi:hypothetical protein